MTAGLRPPWRGSSARSTQRGPGLGLVSSSAADPAFPRAATAPEHAAAQEPALPAAWAKLLIVGLGTMVVPLDSAVNIDFPAIVAHFGLPIPMIQWIVIAYVLTQTSLVLSFGRIGDMVGYRRVFLAGSGVSAIAFMACALAPSYPALVAARIGQGIGAGLLLSCGPALATSLFPETMRAVVLGRYMAMFGIGAALGPSVFGVLVNQFGWSAVFSFRAPIAALAFLLGWLLPRPGRGEAQEKFDAAGGLLLAAALCFLLLTLNQLRHPGAALGASALAAAVGLWLFQRQERRTARPIIDFAYFHLPGFIRINAAHALVNLAAFSIMLLAPFHLSRLPGLSLPAAGLVLAASPCGIVLAAPLAGRLANLVPVRRMAVVGAGLSSLGLFGIAAASTGQDLVWVTLAMAAQGFGMGLFQVAYFDIVTGAIPTRHRGVAGSLGMATRSIGTVTGATLLMLLFEMLRDGSGFAAAFHATFAVAGGLSGIVALGLAVKRR